METKGSVREVKTSQSIFEVRMSCRWLGLWDWKFGRGKRVGTRLESAEVMQAFKQS